MDPDVDAEVLSADERGLSGEVEEEEGGRGRGEEAEEEEEGVDDGKGHPFVVLRPTVIGPETDADAEGGGRELPFDDDEGGAVRSSCKISHLDPPICASDVDGALPDDTGGGDTPCPYVDDARRCAVAERMLLAD